MLIATSSYLQKGIFCSKSFEAVHFGERFTNGLHLQVPSILKHISAVALLFCCEFSVRNPDFLPESGLRLLVGHALGAGSPVPLDGRADP